MIVSVAILTYKRKDILAKLLGQLVDLKGISQIIVVDNDSESAGLNLERFEKVEYVINTDNKGTGARNIAIEKAQGDIVICLDDDVYGLNDNSITFLRNTFMNNLNIGAVCFKVLDASTNQITNWCHHRNPEIWGSEPFDTYEISEGAVAFRVSVLNEAGHYCEEFFISHEGLDLACRILDIGYKINYRPEVCVYHYHHKSGRQSWRRYYYDTRNQFYVAVRNFPLGYAIRYLSFGLLTMLFYSLRDGYLKYYFKAILDGINDLNSMAKQRKTISKDTVNYIKQCNKYRASMMFKIKNRILAKKIQI